MRIYPRLLSYIKPYKGHLAVAFLAMFFFSIFNALVSATLYIIFNGFFNKGMVIIKDLPYVPIGRPIVFSAGWIPFIIIFVFFFRGVFDYISQYMMANVGLMAIRNVRNDLYTHMNRLSLDFYAHGRTGDLISRIMNDVNYIQGAITDVIVDLVKQPLIILFNLPMTIIWGGKLAIIGLTLFPMVSIPIVFLGRKLRKVTRSMAERNADITSVLQETITGVRIVKAFNMEEREVSKFRAVNQKVFDYLRKMVKITIVQRPLIEILGAFAAAFAIWLGIKMLPADRFVAFIGSLFIFYEPLKKISKVNASIQSSIAAGTRIFEIIDKEVTVKEKPDAKQLFPPIHSVNFCDVSFEYDKGIPVLHDINLDVRAGEIVAIVGVSGSGKTSLVNLIPRFYDPVGGAIKINGEDTRNFTLKSLRDQIGIVTQETILFNDSIRDNIAYGKPGASIEEIKEAAIAAQADEFIREMPHGYDTMIGERGVKLSGGQRQRLSIARAMLKNPPILILDEATSQLDTESERLVQEAIERLVQKRTVFVIAHRLSTVQNASRIIVLEDGCVVESGTNDSLLREGGLYRRLYELQFNI
ncbi:MAG: ABC transporter ATP-binding protein [Candidatus Omnitrophica bacterium]|nr:ABC transporter ATP-binding protein [Candidatus Omnitrophota bacterium]